MSEEELAPLDGLVTAERPGVRLEPSSCVHTALGESGTLGRMLEAIEPGVRPVRAVVFNKTERNNWGVPWHQDRVISVRDRVDLPGFRNWSRKSGAWHCEPPARILDDMLFVRVHLDDTDSANGAMEIALGSHRAGVVGSTDAERVAAVCETEICTAERGDVLVLKMKVLHRSLPADSVSNRRVLRIDYASFDLPPPLKWN